MITYQVISVLDPKGRKEHNRRYICLHTLFTFMSLGFLLTSGNTFPCIHAPPKCQCFKLQTYTFSTHKQLWKVHLLHSRMSRII